MERKEDWPLVFPRERMEKESVKRKGKVGEVRAQDEFKVKQGSPEWKVFWKAQEERLWGVKQ